MKLLNELKKMITGNTRRNALAYATNNNYNVKAMYDLASDKWFQLMSKIHSSNKNGNYDLATEYHTVAETLETWI